MISLSEHEAEISEILSHYGTEAQIEKTEEECMELALACRRLRTRPSDEHTMNFYEEIADVMIMLAQMSLGNEVIIKIFADKKIARQLQRIKEETKWTKK